MTLFIQTFRYAAEPFFFAQFKKDDKREIYARVMTYFVITCSFIFLSVMMFMDVIKLFIGEDFRSGLGVVPILLLANLCLGVFYNLSMWYKLTGQTRYGAYFSIAGGILTIALLLLLIPQFGYMGAAWATLITYAAMMVLSYITGQKNYAIPYKVKTDLGYVLLAVAGYAISVLVASRFHLSGLWLWLFNACILGGYSLIILKFHMASFKKSKPAASQNTYHNKVKD
jgi:O-antigen/teichoic acid export membrane protein